MNKVKKKRIRRDLSVLIIIACIISVITLILLEQAWRTISKRYIYEATQRAATEFQRMVGDVEASLSMVRDWGKAGLLAPSNPDKAKDLLQPFFKKNKMLSGISVAGTKNAGFFMLPEGDLNLPGKDKSYNPADRPWFAPALENEECHWTGIYHFYTLERLGITASISWKGNGQQVVSAFDILLDDFFREIQKMAPTPSSHAFIFLPDGQLYVPGSQAAQSEFQSVDLVKDELAIHGMSLWDDNLEWHDGNAPELRVVKTTFNNKAWWCGFIPLEKSQKMVWMGVLVPESDIVGDIAKRRHLFLGIGIGLFLTFGALYSVIVGHHRNTKSEEEESDESRVRRLIADGESRIVEFKSTLRMNLHAKKPGKEIEIAWLKGVAGFLNTDGGTLLIGVTDDGEITGLEQDVFENDDKCRLHFKNLVANHLGAEISKYIRFTLLVIDGKTVGMVQCFRSPEPVFLKNGNKEAFYIRNGPSSDELPVSKALKYIKHRK